MVYCSRCGTQNADTYSHCTNCGAPLYTVGQQYPGSDREHYRRMENECFGLPNGGMIAAVVFGVIIVLVGLSFLLGAYGIDFVFWPFIIIIVGVLIMVGALYGRRQRRYSEPPPRPIS